MATFDVIVVGLGGIGSAALYHLARRGARVLGIDQFGIAHDRGSSHGETRIIRQAYFEHPDYIPLLRRTYALWHELERDAGETLIHKTGLLLCGIPDGEVITGVRRAKQEHDLPIDELSTAEVTRRFPALRVSDDLVSLFEDNAGYLEVEHCVRLHVRLAQERGAQLRLGEPIERWETTGESVSVKVGGSTISANALVLCPGPWAARLFGKLPIPLEVRRKPVFWMPTENPAFLRANCPIYCFDLATGFYYGFPCLDNKTVKVAMHSGGAIVENPGSVDRAVHTDDLAPIAQFVRCHLKDVDTNPQRYGVCMYTLTPDEHAIVGQHPNQPNVYLAAGMSGHGFKFAPLFGARLAAQALGESVPAQLFAILDPERRLPLDR